MAELINASDSLNEGRKKLNAIAKEMNEKDVSSAPEVIEARQGKGSLAANLANKVDRDGSGQVKWANIAQDAREQISGEKVAIVGNDSIITTNLTNQVVKNSKIDNGAVTPRTTSFIKESTNLFNKETVVERKRLDGNGNIINDNLWSYSERIPVLPGQKYYIKYVAMFLWLNQDGSAIRIGEYYDEGTGRTATVPDNIYYMIPIMNMNFITRDIQISLGETAVPFEPYYNSLVSVQVPYDDVLSNLTNQEFEAIQDEFGGKNLYKTSLTFTKESTEEPFYFWTSNPDRFTEELQEGEIYTLSFDLKSTVPTSSDRVYLNGTLTLFKHFDFPIEWKRQYVTFTYNGGGGVAQISPTFYPEASGVRSVRRVKLVKGIDEKFIYRPSPEEYSVITQIDVDSYKEDVIGNVIKRIEIIDSELKDIGNDIPVSEMYQSKQPRGMLGPWTEIPGAWGSLGRITLGYDDNLYFEKNMTVYKLEDLNGTPEAGVNLSGLDIGDLKMMAVFPSGVVYVSNRIVEGNEPYVEVWKAPDYKTEPTLRHTLTGNRTEALATKSQYNGGQEVITICHYSHDKSKDHSAFVSLDGGETIKKVKTTQSDSSLPGLVHYHTMHWDFYQNRLWLGEGDNASNRSIWYSDDIGETWDRIDSNEYQPTLIETFPNRVIFGRDNYIHLPGFWSFERQKTHDDFNKEIKLVDRLSFDPLPDSTAIHYYPERMGFAQEGLVAYHCFEKQVAEEIPSYFYATGDGGQSWHCVYISQDMLRGAFIKDGHLISLNRANNLMKTPLLEWE